MTQDWEHRWRAVVEKELDAMIPEKMVEVHLSDIPKEALILPMVCDLTVKYTPEGIWKKDKFRLPVSGDVEVRKGKFPDRQQLYAPTGNHRTLLMLISLAATYGLTLQGCDVYMAFCNTPITREVYVRLPPQLCNPGLLHNSLN
jgi:hypothetical protein